MKCLSFKLPAAIAYAESAGMGSPPAKRPHVAADDDDGDGE